MIPFDYSPTYRADGMLSLEEQIILAGIKPRKHSPFCVLVEWRWNNETTVQVGVVAGPYWMGRFDVGLSTNACCSSNNRREGKPRYCDLKYDHPKRRSITYTPRPDPLEMFDRHNK